VRFGVTYACRSNIEGDRGRRNCSDIVARRSIRATA
jgi:hypothetical protein